ncbi:hypothetical protein FOZ62_008616 [Perkinsus olseni]|uniref:malate dehydrogenase n=2 Tax=Perkinsus olseni TaxID=32597 RepID=A0A7J6UFM3_PEROL|nr:hypothetical protein FOZ62_008616 [Perkinsus olseni]
MSTKVALLGASGGIGQPLALLLKMNPMITELALYDIPQARTPAAGVAEDVSHINTPAQVKGYAGLEEIEAALTGSDVVIITAGVPRKPGMTRDDLFNINAGIVRDLAKASAQYAPKAMLLIVTNPVNSTVPIAAEVYKKAGVYDHRKVIGVSLLDVTRANTFVAEKFGLDVSKVDVPVIGGHAGVTIMPVFSQCTPEIKIDHDTVLALDDHVQNAGTDVVNAKAGAGSATLAMALAAAKFADVAIRGLRGSTTTACAFVNVPYGDVSFFAYKCDFGPEGLQKVHEIKNLNEHETKRIKEVCDKLKGDIQRGVDFASK